MTHTSPSRYSAPLLIVWLLATVLVTVFYARSWVDAPIRTADSLQYITISQDLQDGALERVHVRSPGYPLFLVLLGSPDGTSRVVVYAQLLLHFASVLLVVDLLRRLGLSSWLIGLVFVLGFLPFSAQCAAHIATEILTEFMIVLGVTGLIRWFRWGSLAWLIAAGFGLAFAGITRPTFQFLAPFFIIILVGWFIVHRPFRAYRRRLPIAAAVLILWTGVIEGGFVAHNRIRFGYLGTVPAGFNLCNKTWKVLDRIPEKDADLRELLIQHRDRVLLANLSGFYIWNALPQLLEATHLTELELSKKLQEVNVRLIIGAPANYMDDVALSVASYWLPFVDSVSFFGRRSIQAAWIGLELLTLFILICLTVQLVGGIALLSRLRLPKFHCLILPGSADGTSRIAGMILMASLFFYTMAISCLFEFAIPRYRQPTDLLIWGFIALEIDLCRRMLRVVRKIG